MPENSGDLVICQGEAVFSQLLERGNPGRVCVLPMDFLDSTSYFNKTQEHSTYLKGWGYHPGPGSPAPVLEDGLLHVKVVRGLQALGAYCTLLEIWNKQSN